MQPAPSGRPRWLSRDEERSLLDAVGRNQDSRDKARDEAIIRLLLNAGLRRSELASLTWAQIQIRGRRGVLAVPGNYWTHRKIPFGIRVHDALVRLQHTNRGQLDRRVIHGQRGPLTMRGIELVVASYRTQAGIPDLTCHVLRHAFCRRLAERGADSSAIAALAGYRPSDMVRRYLIPGKPPKGPILTLRKGRVRMKPAPDSFVPD